jgi:hypothetical protein
MQVVGHIEEPTNSAPTVRSAEELRVVYRDLIGHGFRAVDVQEAFRALLDITDHAALDWLCMHVAPEHLPGRFAGA